MYFVKDLPKHLMVPLFLYEFCKEFAMSYDTLRITFEEGISRCSLQRILWCIIWFSKGLELGITLKFCCVSEGFVKFMPFCNRYVTNYRAFCMNDLKWCMSSEMYLCGIWNDTWCVIPRWDLDLEWCMIHGVRDIIRIFVWRCACSSCTPSPCGSGPWWTTRYTPPSRVSSVRSGAATWICKHIFLLKEPLMTGINYSKYKQII
jgi:hypothetical protein